ncbi:uncharacterized protein [Penaeus vannamei]|uniref:uncharacterized protein n=1 Tax=Penaeus vannamei TaxID=6689 RepID=UPI00387F56A7
MMSVSRQSRTRSMCQRPLQWASCRVPACLSSSACSESVDPSFSRQRSSLSKELRGSRGSKRGIASGAMAGWRRVVVAALLQLAFSRVLPADGNCYEGEELPIGRGYFTCSEPRLNFNDTQKKLVMDFRNRNKNIVFTLSLNRTAGAFHLITYRYTNVINSTKLDLPDSSNELQLNINRSSVHAKTQGSWRKLDILETKEIFSLYIRCFPPNPPFCITCHGGDIWHNDKADTTQNTEQGVVQTTQNTEQGVVQTTQTNEQDTEHQTGFGTELAMLASLVCLLLLLLLLFLA